MNDAIVLMYHNIGNPPRRRDPVGTYVSQGMFRFQMWYLKAAGFTVVPLKDIADFISGRSSLKRAVALTFDDGYQDFFDNAYPVLRRYRYPSTVFLVSERIGEENIWEEDRKVARSKLLAWDTIHLLKKEGVVFGSHSGTHPFLSRLTHDQLVAEVSASRASLEAQLQLQVDFFCYPYGDYDPSVVEAVKQAGYTLAVTTRRGLVHKGDDPFQIRRSFIRSRTNPFLYSLRLHSGYEDRKRSV